MWGAPCNVSEMARIYEETRGPSGTAENNHGPNGEELSVLVPETNKEGGTYDGIDWCGERVTEEVRVEANIALDCFD